MAWKNRRLDLARIPQILFLGIGAMCLMFATHGELAHAQLIKSSPQPLRVIKPSTPEIVLQEKEVTPPSSVAVYAQSDSVTLKSGSTDSIVKSLRVKRKIPFATLRASPVITLGKAKVDMKPVLANPASLFNVAARLRNQRALADVMSENTEVLEVDQGLIIRQFLTYRIKPGVCSNSARRMALLRSGVRCSTRLTSAERAAAFANPNDPHYVADRTKRAQAIVSASKTVAAEQSKIAGNLAQFRTMMKDSAQRAQIEREIGANEALRLEALGDVQLEAELRNSAETRVEQVMFVPAKDRLDRLIPSQITPFRPSMLQIPENVDAEHALQQQIFLTGFTLGREYEWRNRVSVSIKWCVVGCKRTYYAEVYAGFNYGFGLRFPIKTGGLYAYHRINNQESASVAPVFEPINGTSSDYAASGLAGNKLFDGKELVAQFGSYAGMSFKVPVLGSGGVRFDLEKDFTDGLPAPFTDGQFRPPTPGESNPPAAEIVFDNPDLIGGRGNFGVAGALVLPAVKVSLTSERLRLKLTDRISGIETEMLSSGQAYPLAVDPNDHSSSFSIGYPEYDLAFQVTPGLNARLFIDVAVWSDHWDWPVWFPQVAVTLPPGGTTFKCHENTICSRNYRYSPTVTEEEIGDISLPDDPIEAKAEEWARSFKKRWLPKCPQEEIKWCEVAINAVATNTRNGMINEMTALGTFPSSETNLVFIRRFAEADKMAPEIILNGKVRDVERYGKSLVEIYEPFWSNGCMDHRCRYNIHGLTEQYVKALMNRQQASPSAERNEVVSQENMQGNWAGRAKQEVESSEARARAH